VETRDGSAITRTVDDDRFGTDEDLADSNVGRSGVDAARKPNFDENVVAVGAEH